MISRVLRKVLIPLLILNYTILSLYPEQQGARGAELSILVENSLLRNGFSPQRKELCLTGSDTFAFNIIVDIYGKTDTENTRALTAAVCISQEDFAAHSEEVSALMEFTRNANLDYSVEFVFTALDNISGSLPGYDIELQGTENFAFSVDSSDNIFALLINFDAEGQDKCRIFTTGGKKSTPRWLAKETVDSFIGTKTRFSIPQKFLSLYRAGLLFGDRQTALFLARSIPCIKIELNSSSVTAIEEFLQNHKNDSTRENDVHYVFLLPGNFRAFWISEQTNVIALEVFGALTILFLVCFSFTGKKRIRSKKDFSRYWLMIPLMIGISMASLYAGQVLCINASFIKGADPIIQFASKLLVSILLISILFLFQLQLKLPDTSFVWGFFVAVISVANIFLFSIADINLFWTFMIEFILIYATKNATSIAGLVVSFFVLVLPFLPYLAVYFANASSQDVQILIRASNGTNFLLSLVLFPLQIIWLRILVRVIKGRREFMTFKKTAAITGVSAAVIFAFVIAFVFFSTEFLYRKQDNKKEAVFTDRLPQNLSIFETARNLPQLSAHTLRISSKTQAERYIVSVSSPQSSPVLDSNYSFFIEESSRKNVFRLPDIPPEEISIEFSTENQLAKEIEVTAIYKSGEDGVYIRERISRHIYGTDRQK